MSKFSLTRLFLFFYTIVVISGLIFHCYITPSRRENWMESNRYTFHNYEDLRRYFTFLPEDINSLSKIRKANIEKYLKFGIWSIDENFNINCTDCEYCHDCVNCVKCKFCDNCVNCVKCKDCWYCKGCANCEYCNYCINCKDCLYCEFCANCAKCKNCKALKKV